jgi:hypothetical protein
MAVQAFIFGNANALAAAEATHIAGAASAVLGVTHAVAMATSAPSRQLRRRRHRRTHARVRAPPEGRVTAGA